MIVEPDERTTAPTFESGFQIARNRHHARLARDDVASLQPDAKVMKSFDSQQL